jgi:formylglycine-generating enzyme required for sulfatase activity
MKLIQQIFSRTRNLTITKLNLFFPLLFLFLLISCEKNSTEPANSNPKVAITYPVNGAELKADTIYTITADATADKSMWKVEFYIDGKNVSSDNSSPYEYIWNTLGLSGDYTIVAKGYDMANNIGASPTINIRINGTANHAPASSSNPWPVNSAIGISISPTLRWSCTDPDNDGLLYDIYLGINSNPSTMVVNGLSATIYSNNSLANNSTYYWKVVAKDSKGATSTSPVWSFTTSSNIKSQDLVQVSGGTFQMGGPTGVVSALPVHSVTVSSFSMDKYEIMYDKWTEVRNWGLTNGYSDLPVGQNGYTPIGASNPVTMIYWPDAIKWCNARSEKDGLTPVFYTDSTQTTVLRGGSISPNFLSVKWNANGYRLPTEAEWEFAARGGINSQGYTYSGSNTSEDVAWFYSNTNYLTYSTRTVGTKSANELGIFDMSGNVMELCWDQFGDYSGTAQTNPRGATSGTSRVIRGGSFFDLERDWFVVNRMAISTDAPNPNYELYIGFRCVKN